MSVTEVTAWQDCFGRLHKTKMGAEAEELRRHAEDFVSYSPPPRMAEHYEIAQWLLARARDLPALASKLNPKETP